MTLLRRAPREVYRVYGEEEFLAYAGGDERFEAAGSGTGERRLQRVAGATMLLAAMGAVGGLVAITSLSSVAGDGRRVGAGLLAATGSLVSSRAARAHVWRGRAGSDGPRDQRVRDRQADRRSAQDQQADRVRGVRPAGPRPRAAVVALPPPGAPIEAAPPASVARLTARASAGPQRSGQSEFGFER